MEKDDREAQVNELGGRVAERRPQQLHAGHDHQEDVPAVGRARKDSVKDCWGLSGELHQLWFREHLLCQAATAGGGGSVVIHICQRSKHSLRVWVPCLRSHGAERGLKLSPGGLWSTAQGAANFCPMISSVPCPPQGHGVPLDASRNRVRCPILVGHPGYAFIFLNV